MNVNNDTMEGCGDVPQVACPVFREQEIHFLWKIWMGKSFEELCHLLAKERAGDPSKLG